MPSEAIHQLIVSVDAHASGTRVGNAGQLTLRHVIYDVVATAHAAAAADPDPRYAPEDRGDGVLLLFPADLPKARVVGPWVEEIHQALRRHNSQLREPVRLRIGIHAGEVHGDPHGIAGVDVNIACRLANCAAARQVLDAAPAATLVVAVSGPLYQSVIRHGGRFIDPNTYRSERLEAGEYDGAIWVTAPGYSSPPRPAAAPPRPARPSGGPTTDSDQATRPTFSVGRDGVVVVDSTAHDINFYGAAGREGSA